MIRKIWLLIQIKLKGILITIIIALISTILAKLPILSIMGVMILSIFIGMMWKRMFVLPTNAESGIVFTTKSLLKLGIILLGVRLNIYQILADGYFIFCINVIVITFSLSLVLYFGKLLSVEKQITTLIPVGTAVCGASAILAIAPIIKSNKQSTVVAIACISIIGTLATIIYILTFSIFNINSVEFGVIVGATLQEVSHVAATGLATNQLSYDTAIITKLGRVALLIPVSIIIGRIFQKKEEGSLIYRNKLPVPWFIFGFLGMAIINSFGLIPVSIAHSLMTISSFLISMAMAGIGLNVNFVDLKKAGMRPVIVSIVGYVSLLILVLILIRFF